MKADAELLVDTGATYTVLPGKLLESLGVMVREDLRNRLADWKVLERPLGEVGLEIQGFKATATPAVFGTGETRLLGSVTVEQLGPVPDPIEKRLKTIDAHMQQTQATGERMVAQSDSLGPRMLDRRKAKVVRVRSLSIL